MEILSNLQFNVAYQIKSSFELGLFVHGSDAD